jgi:thiol-disulfide isomerase/thioredoxin
MKRQAIGLLMIGVVLGTMASMAARAATPSVQDALKLEPVHRDVEVSRPSPDEVERCTISVQKEGGHSGWVVKSPNGAVLRKYLDTNDDNYVDQRCFYKDGLEVYRDIDGDFNGTPDQHRWFHTAGTRWGLDEDEDRRIDTWKVISAEEVTAEVIAALAARDARRFSRVVLTPEELKTLGLGKSQAEKLGERIDGLTERFGELASRQRAVTSGSEWVQFSGNRPGVVPAGTQESTKDLKVYENVVAIVQSGDRHLQVQMGTLVEVGDVWRVIDLPQLIVEGQSEMASTGFFFQGPLAETAAASSAGTSEQFQKLLAALEKLEPDATRQRADLIEKIAAEAPTAEDRAMWLRQLADEVSAAVQTGSYAQGVERLEDLCKRLGDAPGDRELAAYVRFRQLSADYGLRVQSGEDFAKIQQEWIKNLEGFVSDYPKSLDTAEAMLQLAIAQEFAGEEEKATRWYGRIVQDFPDSAAAGKAAGARRRLEAVGKKLDFQGKSPEGKTIDLADFRGKVVLIQYWATWCGPCKTDMDTLKELLAKHGGSGFTIIGVSLDDTAQEMAGYVREKRLPWPQIFEEGGLDSRPANTLGILTLPTMILVDQQGKVVNRNVHASELDEELKRLLGGS